MGNTHCQSLPGINIEYDLDEVKTRTGGATTTNVRLQKKNQTDAQDQDKRPTPGEEPKGTWCLNLQETENNHLPEHVEQKNYLSNGDPNCKMRKSTEPNLQEKTNWSTGSSLPAPNP